MGNEWQTVPTAKDKRKRAETKAKAREPQAQPRASDETSTALASFDAEWARRSRQQEEAAVQQLPRAQAFTANGNNIASDGGAFSGLQLEETPPPSPKTAASGETLANGSGAAEAPVRKAPKPKKPKAKKVTPAEVAADIAPGDLNSHLEDLERKYKDDETAQLEAVADYFLRIFKECDIPFNKTVLDQPLQKSVNVPLQDLPEGLRKLVSGYLARKNAQALADVTSVLAQSLIESVPAADASKVQPPKAKVGLLMLISLILRARPEVLLLLAPSLLGKAQSFSGPRRLPFQLWIIHQVTRSEPAVAVAVWCRVLLPQLLGAQLPSTGPQKPAATPAIPQLGGQGAISVLRYLESVLELAGAGKGSAATVTLGPRDGDSQGRLAIKAADTALLKKAQRGIDVQVGGATACEPVVPAGALDAIVRACFAGEPAFGPTPARIRLLQLHEELREMHLAALHAGATRPHDAVRLALETAGLAAEAPLPAGQPNEIIQQAARSLVDMFHVEPAGTASAWENRHKQQIRGSAAVLQSLQPPLPHNLQQLLRNSHRRPIFLRTLRHLRERHRSLLKSSKNWQQSCARAADHACGSIAGATARQRRSNAAANVVLMAAFLALVAVFLSRQEVVREAFVSARGSELGQRLTHLVQPLIERAEPIYRERVVPLASSLRDRAASEYDARLRPLARHALDQLGPLARAIEHKMRALANWQKAS